MSNYLGQGIEVIKIIEAAGSEERVTYVTYGPFHAAFSVTRAMATGRRS